MKTHYPVIVIGGGQAGLSISYCLKSKNIEHIVFDKGSLADSWNLKRWDNFTLVTPNWQCEMPGYKYSGEEPNGFMNKEQVVDFITGYASSFNPPIKNNVLVTSVEKNDRAYVVKTSLGTYTAQEVVIASGAFHNPLIPPVAKKLPSYINNLHSSEYKNGRTLGDKDIMVVGSGQSGCQIAEDLHLEGKNVHLCVGNAPKSPRNYRGKDVVKWLDEMGYYEQTIESFPDPAAVRRKINHYVTGRDGGREIDLRQFAKEGMKLYSLFKDVVDGKIIFGTNLAEDLDKADASAQSIKDRIDAFIKTNKIDAPTEEVYVAPWTPQKEITSINLQDANIGTIIWCVGFKSDFSWLKIPVFDETGYPINKRGVTDYEGLYFLGWPWMHTWGSGRFSGITQDAWHISEHISERVKLASAS